MHGVRDPLTSNRRLRRDLRNLGLRWMLADGVNVPISMAERTSRSSWRLMPLISHTTRRWREVRSDNQNIRAPVV